MRRPINWVVFCISLLFLVANRPFTERETSTPIAQAMPAVINIDRPDPEFGYVRDDGSFVPLAQQVTTKAKNQQSF